MRAFQRLVVEPAEGPEFKKDRLALDHGAAVVETDVAAHAAALQFNAHDLLAAQPVDRDALPADAEPSSALSQRAAGEFAFGHVPQARVEEHRGIAAELCRYDAVLVFDAAQQLLLALIKQ